MTNLRKAAQIALEAMRNAELIGMEQLNAMYELQKALAQTEWIGLTKEEFEQAVDGLEDLEDCWIQIEAKLKEKNGN